MKNILGIIFLVVFACGLYAVTLKGVAGSPDINQGRVLDKETEPFELSPERGRYVHVVVLAETGQYALTKEQADFAYPDVGYYKGRFFGYFAPGIAYMAAPIYRAAAAYGFGQLAVYGFVSVFAILNLLLIYLIGRQVLGLPAWAGLFAALLFGFGSTSWSYAVTLYQHHLTSFFILSGFYATWRYAKGTRFSWGWGLWVWAAFGLAFSVDYPNLVLYSPVLVYFGLASLNVERGVTSWKVSLRPALILTSVVGLLLVGLHGYHNSHYYSSSTRLSGSLPGYKTIVENNLLGAPESELTAYLAKEAARKENLARFFSEERLPLGFGTLFFSKDRGLLFYSPIFLLAFVGLFQLGRKRLDLPVGVLLGLIVANLFLYSSWGDPWGGWAYGPRYLIPIMPLLSLGAAYFLATGGARLWKRLLALPLLVFSVATAVVGVVTTNAIPPQVEAAALNTQSNFIRSLTFLGKGESSSYFYRTVVSHSYSLSEFAVAIGSVVVLVLVVVLFILPLLEKTEYAD